MSKPLSRRAFLGRTGALGCSLAASPLVTPVTFAAAPGENRLVVIVLRGAMDGLAAVQPLGDPSWAELGRSVGDAPLELDGFFAAHAGLSRLGPLWQQGQLGFVHAVSTPYRDGRSHFDGQDLLEAGISDLSGGLSRDGWLNRMLGHYPGLGRETAYAVGRGAMSILSGSAPVSRWTPEADLALTPQALRLAEQVMQDDPAFAAAMSQALSIAGAEGSAMAAAPDGRQSPEQRLARFVAEKLRGPSRIASFSLNGWDTHERQEAPLTRALERLSDTILTLQEGMGASVWDRTAVVAMTEFGRTARINGTGGTDHGTGGALILAGGAIRGGRVISDWPGLDEASLYDRRDLMPTRDLRAHAGWLMRGLFGLGRGAIERDVFPDVDLGPDPRLLL